MAKRRGNYYLKKTVDFFRSNGYTVERLEKSQRIQKGNDVIFVKSDLFGADLLAMNQEEIIFIQVKTNRVDIAKGLRGLAQFPCPARQAVVIWEPRAKEPEIIELEKP